MVGVELEVLAKKYDRYGWERDRGTHAHDRMVSDWMDALQDYPLAEVQAACRQAVVEGPHRMPNEGHIRSLILGARKRAIAGLSLAKPEPERERITAERAAEILAQANIGVRRMPNA